MKKATYAVGRAVMIFLKNILITTDLSEYSLAALEYAFTFGLLFGARLCLLYVDEQGQHRSDRNAAAALEGFAASRIDSRLNLELVTRSGRPAEEISRYAREQGMDLIVMATHGRTGLKQAAMGSVAQKVIRLSAVPVLAVKPHAVRESLLRFADVENELHLR
ncbi:MAG: universal stress protein [Bacteroidota bacterium]